MNIERGILLWDLEMGLVQANILYPREINYTYYNMAVMLSTIKYHTLATIVEIMARLIKEVIIMSLNLSTT
jgi:hypothetical protein